MNSKELIAIEELENKYLLKYYHFLKFVEDDILKGLDTKNTIKDNWLDKWNKNIQYFL